MLKVKTLKPQQVEVEDDEGGKYVLRSPGEAEYCDWNDAKLAGATFDAETGKQVRFEKLHASTRALLVGLCLHNSDGKPVGADFVRQRFQPASITVMYDWCFQAGGFGATAEDAKN
jgi:hypothetical protein